jgi:hypothetical protein
MTDTYEQEARRLVDKISVPLSEMRGQSRAADEISAGLRAAHDAAIEEAAAYLGETTEREMRRLMEGVRALKTEYFGEMQEIDRFEAVRRYCESIATDPRRDVRENAVAGTVLDILNRGTAE